MLGPLPPLHKTVVCVLALVACAGVAAWLADSLPLPVLPGAAALAGGAVGLVLALLSPSPPQQPRAARAASRRSGSRRSR